MKAAEPLDGLVKLEQIVRPVIWSGNFAQSIVGMYSLEATDKGIVWGIDGIRQNHLSPCDDIPTAKACVDEHYRARISSALNLEPILSEIKRMREALAAMLGVVDCSKRNAPAAIDQARSILAKMESPS